MENASKTVMKVLIFENPFSPPDIAIDNFFRPVAIPIEPQQFTDEDEKELRRIFDEFKKESAESAKKNA